MKFLAMGMNRQCRRKFAMSFDLLSRTVGFGCDAGQSPPIQTCYKARKGNHCRKTGRRFGARHAEQHIEAGRYRGTSLMRYAVVIERANGNYSAYVPDLPGCIATGESVETVEKNIREAIRFHIDGLVEDCQPIPAPTALAEYVEA
jgi:predicted RNase H-like HicB family nuclease